MDGFSFARGSSRNETGGRDRRGNMKEGVPDGRESVRAAGRCLSTRGAAVAR